MANPVDDLIQRTLAEPFKTKMVERLRVPSRAERESILREAFYSPVYLNASDVYIDLLTDSGTGAMSDEQWSALMRGDEAYIRSRSFLAFESAVQDVMGFQHVVPTHQGRAAEHIMMGLFLKAGDIVLSNTHFDTTRAHVEHQGALPVDLVGDALWDFQSSEPFKGDFDLVKLKAALARHGSRVRMIIITVLNNFACSSPVSMENIREVRRIAREYGVPVFFDACRFAENAYFIKTREPGYASKSVKDIVREMLAFGDGCWMSAKKDAITNVGGFIATNDEDLARRCQERVVLYEGFYTYGGLARRDLEAIAVGLREGIEESYLAHRVGLVAYLGELLEAQGVVVSKPVGGSGVFIDVQAMYPHLRPEQMPGIAFFCDLYLEGAVRAAAAPFAMHTVSPSGELVDRVFQFARLAIPRRVYSRSQMEYTAAVVARARDNAASNEGYRLLSTASVLGHFFAKFEPLAAQP